MSVGQIRTGIENMKKQTVFSKIIYWLKNSEMFARPSKQLPGKWELFEYYTDQGEELIHKKEKQLKEEKLHIHIEFLEDGKFLIDSNLPINIFSEEGTFMWSLAKNYLTIIHKEDFRKNEEFQFAIVKETLKLLKKDNFGKIILFGFFRKTENKK